MITTFYPPYHFGGDGVFVRALSRELASLGHSVEVVHCEDAYRLRGQPITESRDNDGIVVHRLHSRLGAISPLITQQTGRPGLKRAALRKILNKPFDVIHFHNISLVGGPGVLALGSAPVKLYTAHEHWLVCPTHVLWKNRSRSCEKPDCLRCCLVSGTPPQLWRYTGLMERSLRHIDALLAPSDFTAERHRTAGVECPIRVLPHFATIVAPPVAPAPADSRASFLYVGRLTASKGVMELVDQFVNLPQYDLLLAGDGELLEPLRRRIGEARHIRLLGSVAHADLISLYQRATAVIVPSVGPEAFGLVAVESMACGTPVIVREAGGSGEAVLATGGGVVYRSAEEFLKAVHRMATDRAWRESLAHKACEGYEKHYTASVHLRDYLQIIEAIRASKIAAGATQATA